MSMNDRERVVSKIQSWVGKDKKQFIIDTYNKYYFNTKRKVKMQNNWPWCACTWSALAIDLGLTDKMPVEISCGELIKLAQEMGIWEERDEYIPEPGDAVLYDWDDSGSGDNVSWPDHIGTVVYVNKASGYFVVVEGNYNDAIKKRTVSINGRYIRGFITPKYDGQIVVEPPLIESGKTIDEIAHEVIAGIWGKGDARKVVLEAAGYDYRKVQDRVNEIINGSAVKPSTSAPQTPSQPTYKTITSTCYAQDKDSEVSGQYITTANLYLRNDAGTNKKALCLIPQGTPVRCWGFYSEANNVKWLYIEVILDGVRYIGFSSGAYLKKIS